MKLMKKILTLAVFLSVSAHATEIDNLLDTSGSIRDTFDLGIQTVGGQYAYGYAGGISPEIAQNAFLTQGQADAYNTALTAMKQANTNMTAQEYYSEQSDVALDNLSAAVDDYVTASVQLISVVQVNDMASDATTTEKAVELQTYVTNNDLAITEEIVTDYNDTLQMVETASQTAASFMAVANDKDLLGSAQAQADALGESFYYASNAFYSQGSFTVDLASGGVSLDVSGYLKTAEEVLTAGAESTFYTTSPTGSDCFYGGCDE
jgi:hypothetical protein